MPTPTHNGQTAAKADGAAGVGSRTHCPILPWHHDTGVWPAVHSDRERPVMSYIVVDMGARQRFSTLSKSAAWPGEFPGIFVRDPAMVPNRPRPGVETL